MATIRASYDFGSFEVLSLSLGKYKTNCYVLRHYDTGDAVIIDPGFEPEHLESYLQSLSARPSRILLTHGHFDHVGAVDALAELYNIPCFCDARESRLVRQASTYAFRFGRISLRPPRRITFVDSFEPFDWHGLPIVAHETPGHTFGSVSFAVGDRCVFSGDTLFWEAVGPSHYPESEPARVSSSIERILSCCAPSAVLFPGHGKPWTVAEAREWWSVNRDNPPKLSLFGLSARNDDVPAAPKVEPSI